MRDSVSISILLSENGPVSGGSEGWDHRRRRGRGRGQSKGADADEPEAADADTGDEQGVAGSQGSTGADPIVAAGAFPSGRCLSWGLYIR